MVSRTDEERAVQRHLLEILTENCRESRYGAFETFINTYEEDCYRRARKGIENCMESSYNKRYMMGETARIYKTIVKDYAVKHRQAILDNRNPEQIARKASAAVYALCQELFFYLHIDDDSAYDDDE